MKPVLIETVLWQSSIVSELMTLDGVMQAPGGRDEDRDLDASPHGQVSASDAGPGSTWCFVR
jgi:hypothetical protein